MQKEIDNVLEELISDLQEINELDFVGKDSDEENYLVKFIYLLAKAGKGMTFPRGTALHLVYAGLCKRVKGGKYDRHNSLIS